MRGLGTALLMALGSVLLAASLLGVPVPVLEQPQVEQLNIPFEELGPTDPLGCEDTFESSPCTLRVTLVT